MDLLAIGLKGAGGIYCFVFGLRLISRARYGTCDSDAVPFVLHQIQAWTNFGTPDTFYRCVRLSVPRQVVGVWNLLVQEREAVFSQNVCSAWHRIITYRLVWRYGVGWHPALFLDASPPKGLNQPVE